MSAMIDLYQSALKHQAASSDEELFWSAPALPVSDQYTPVMDFPECDRQSI